MDPSHIQSGKKTKSETWTVSKREEASVKIDSLCWTCTNNGPLILVGKRSSLTLMEKTSVSAAAAIGPAYAKGGEEYYDQMLLRNRCIAKFEEPVRRYNLEGELIQGLVRTKKVPILELKNICKEAAKL